MSCEPEHTATPLMEHAKKTSPPTLISRPPLPGNKRPLPYKEVSLKWTQHCFDLGKILLGNSM